jgi:hypothetical protein
MEDRMIAYNHYIKFIPELKNSKSISGSFSSMITVKESAFPELHEKLLYERKFFNNQCRNLSLYTDREFARTEEGQFWAFEVKEVVTFFWHSSSVTIKYIPQKNFTQELLKYWCLHIILPIFFTIEETYSFLHAGAVEVDGKPILFIADSFGGKSTMTDFFMKHGHMMISDDKVATYEDNGLFLSVPSHSHHRPYRKMEDLGFFVEKFATKPKPIHAVYELEKAEQNARITIAELKGIEKFKSLRYSSEINLFFQKQKQFEYLMQMSKSLHIFKVTIPWNIDRLEEVYDVIVEHSKNIEDRDLV